MNKPARLKKVVTIGGGTGSFTVLSGLKNYPLDITAIVSMADDGGSTGKLRDELGVLPPGDIRQCLVALSRHDRLMRELMQYRFPKGGLKGHSFGNLLLSSLEKITGSFDIAVDHASKILNVEGRVVPATLDKITLVAHCGNKKIIRGEHAIENCDLTTLHKIELKPKARANPKAVRALREADLIIVAPGNLYQSIIPNLLVSGISRAAVLSKAKKVYICNLMTKAGHTDGLGVRDFTRVVERHLGGKVHHVLYNKKRPDKMLLARYGRKGERFVEPGKKLPKNKFIGADLVGRKMSGRRKGDPLKRNLIRHDSDALARLLLKFI